LIQKKVIAALFSLIFIFPGKAQDRAAWMREAHFGLMVHYLADWRVRVDSIKMNPDKWNELVDHFNVELLARQIDSVGAGYLIFTIGQNSGYYVSPNSNYAKLTGIPNKCARRDLISDLSAALKKYNIRLIVYLPSGAPAGDSIARTTLNWTNGPFPNKEFQLKWESIIREWSVRWGDKIAGWWFDGCYWPNIMYRSETPPNFNSFANAARAGNAESIIGFNPGVVYRTLSITPFEDYTAGEIDKPELISIRRASEGKVDGKQIHILSYLGRTWGMGEPRFTTEQVLNFSRQVIDQRGAFSWDVPVLIDGTIGNLFMQQLIDLGKKYRQ
jgi:hypothetical protein